jgi:tRNA threonylcarbamoyladenosine biosynthesis protein TsaE
MSAPKSVKILDAEGMMVLGATLGRHVFAGAVIGLTGPMGAGKTTLVRGTAAGMEIMDGFIVSSPTYTILQSYPCRKMDLFHLDLFRVSGQEDLDSTGYRDAIHDESVLIIEWVDREPDAVPEENLQICLEYGEEGRKVTFLPYGKKYGKLVNDVIADFTGN